MSDHLSSATLNALADGELAAQELAPVSEHLRGCASCTSHALEQSLLKSATARAGERYAPTPEMRERMERLMSLQIASNSHARKDAEEKRSSEKSGVSLASLWTGRAGWAMAATLLLTFAGLAYFENSEGRVQTAAVERAALVTEVSDQHIATLAANLAPQVLSSDRHTVKPWFQGKIPFSFNLPEGLPEDTKLDGANLTYLHNRPVAQLLYSIGRHRVSVFVEEKAPGAEQHPALEERSGFRLAGFSTSELSVVAISDVDPARLKGLVTQIEQAQK